MNGSNSSKGIRKVPLVSVAVGTGVAEFRNAIVQVLENQVRRHAGAVPFAWPGAAPFSLSTQMSQRVCIPEIANAGPFA